MITVYGIRNCDKIKRTLLWFGQNEIAVQFHDYRKDGIDDKVIDTWLEAIDWNHLINRAGTTWRALPTAIKADVTSARAAKRLMTSHPALIKRPLIATDHAIHVGYDEAVFLRISAKKKCLEKPYLDTPSATRNGWECPPGMALQPLPPF